jgi:hypothetical protein
MGNSAVEAAQAVEHEFDPGFVLNVERVFMISEILMNINLAVTNRQSIR